MPRIAFAWVGCKLNRYEIQVMSERLAPYGFECVPFARQADCYVINTCTVTSDADLSSRQLIRRARRRSPEAKIVATGCYAQLRPEEIQELQVNCVISNRDKDKLPEIVLDLFDIMHESQSDIESDAVISGMGGMTRAFVKIQDGCDEQCAFCAIWTARGPVRSRPIKSIIRETNRLFDNGYKEIVLTGVHIGKYLHNGLDFVGLFKNLVDETSIDRIRLSSLNPTEISDTFIEVMASNPRLCPYIHLSVQSGDDKVLQAMGRKYNRIEVIDAVRRLIDARPSMTIGADFIVGFPGENDENFENTIRLVDENPFYHLHVFPYSDRPGTWAEGLADKIPHGVREQRAKRLRELGQKKKHRHMSEFIGKTLQVLVEDRNASKDGLLTGLSENYMRVNISGPKELKTQIIAVIPETIVDGKLTAIFKI